MADFTITFYSGINKADVAAETPKAERLFERLYGDKITMVSTSLLSLKEMMAAFQELGLTYRVAPKA